MQWRNELFKKTRLELIKPFKSKFEGPVEKFENWFPIKFVKELVAWIKLIFLVGSWKGSVDYRKRGVVVINENTVLKSDIKSSGKHK